MIVNFGDSNGGLLECKTDLLGAELARNRREETGDCA
jgi:hypothetical protein